MYCKYCGKQIADDSVFCQYCGGNVADNYIEDKENCLQNDDVEMLSNAHKETEIIKPEIEYKKAYEEGGGEDGTKSEQFANDGQNTTSKVELRQIIEEEKQIEEKKQGKNKKSNIQPKKKKGCLTIFFLVAAILFGQWFIKPMAKLYMRQRMKHQVESSGVYGAGLDRAEPIMYKIKNECPSNLGLLGNLNEVSYGVGTISIKFKNSDYDNSSRYRFESEIAAKNFLTAEIHKMPNSLKDVMKEIVEEDFSLSVEISSETTYKSTNIFLNPNELSKALNQ